MTDHLSEARLAIERASDEVDDATLRRQLESIDEALMEQTETDEPVGDQLEELETELARIMDGADGAALEHVQSARDAIDAYRQTYTQDW